VFFSSTIKDFFFFLRKVLEVVDILMTHRMSVVEGLRFLDVKRVVRRRWCESEYPKFRGNFFREIFLNSIGNSEAIF
jgi:hypothetical protein